MLVDSHAHLDDARFAADLPAVLARARAAGVGRIVTIGNGAGPDDMGCGLPLAEAADWVYTTAGVHPHDAAKVEPGHYALMESLAAHPRVVALGEMGLDYHYDHSPRDVQRAVFRRQLELAGRLDLPAVIHTREADADTMEILREVRAPRGVIHCFTGGPALAACALELGWALSFSGVVTFKTSGDLRAIAREAPADRILVETDAPYLAPIPYRGRRNEPAFVAATAEALAELRGVELEAFARQTTANARALFSF